MADACCGPEPEHRSNVASAEPVAAVHIWSVRELQLAALAAAVLTVSWAAGRAGAHVPANVLAIAAAIVGAATFVPSTLRNLRHGRIGVGTLMTIAAIGAVALGQFNEAAMLGILFSIAEG